MPNPTLHWRKLAPVTPGVSGSIPSALDAIYTAFTAATYYNSAARTPGSGSAWTASRYQNSGTTEAVYLTPPTSTALAQRVIFAGAASGPSPSPTMNTWDAWANAKLLVGINKNSGAFSSWNSATPFTSGTFSGYWGCWRNAFSGIIVNVYESEESVLISLTYGTASWLFAAGAIVDPLQTGSGLAETDGRLYGMMVSGSNGTCSQSFMTESGGGKTFLDTFASDENAHAFVWTGQSTSQNYIRKHAAHAYSSKTNALDYPAAIAIPAQNYSGSARVYGVYRGMYSFKDYQSNVTLQNGGVDIGYIVGSNPTSSGQALFLPY